MRPDRLPHPQTLLPLIRRLGSTNIDLELFVLKCHLIAERQLYSLLAIRLEIDEKHLPPLQFLPLAKLALGGSTYNQTLVQVLALNDLRNEFAHEFEENELLKRMEKLATLTQTFWPPHDPTKQPTDFSQTRDSSVRVACFFVITDVWIHIAQQYLERDSYSPAWQEADARAELNRTLERRAADRRSQQAFQRVYDWIFSSATP